MSRFARTLVAVIALGALVGVAGFAPAAEAAEHRLGFGFHYWETLDDVDFDNIESDGLSQVFSYQYVPGGLVRFEVDVEYFDKGFAGAIAGEEAYSPQVYLLFGGGIYAGIGAGATYSDGFASGEEWSDIFYAAKGGFDFAILPAIHLDINANYRFEAFSELEDVESEVLTLGAIARFSF